MKNSSIVTLIILLIVTVTIIVFISKTGEDSGINLTLEQLERVNELSNWQEYNGIEYAIGMRIIAVRTANDQKLLWALPAEEYEDKNLARAGFFELSAEEEGKLWFFISDRISDADLVSLNFNDFSLESYSLPQSIHVLARDYASGYIVFEKTTADFKTVELHLLNFINQDDKILEVVPNALPPGSMAYIWPTLPEWVSVTQLKYRLPSGEVKIYNLETEEYTLISE